MLRCPDVAALAEAAAPRPLGEDDADRVSLIARHLFWPKSGGVFLHGDELTDRALVAAYKQIAQQKPAEAADEDDEGVVAELAPGVSESSPAGGAV
jgi:hypothetical protein